MLQQRQPTQKTRGRSPKRPQLRKHQSLAAAVKRAKQRLADANINFPMAQMAATPPEILQHPRDQQVVAGQDAEFVVVAVVRCLTAGAAAVVSIAWPMTASTALSCQCVVTLPDRHAFRQLNS